MYQSMWNLKNHYTRVHAEKHYKCSKCPKTYGSKALAEAHKTESHSKKTCEECGKIYNNLHSLKLHQTGHNINLNKRKYNQVLRVHGKVYDGLVKAGGTMIQTKKSQRKLKAVS
ncbi:Zinc finger protein [Operophtera brumata]|uniref:Zinc finger protein n=1 Tax=Operophtera brumata TaxID=104452 RepID=A0A0L7K489_OPEBR|nr:Zinc finger protein [Operophtera brumata]